MHPQIESLHANDLASKAERTKDWTTVECECCDQCMKPYMQPYILHELHGVIQMSVHFVFWLFLLMAVFVGFLLFFLQLLSLGFEHCMASLSSYTVFCH